MKVRYVGVHARIDYPVPVERGKIVDVPAELGRQLVKQSSWERVQTKKKKSDTADG